MYIVSDVFEILHVRLYDESPEQGEVWVFDVVDLHETPGVLSTTQLLAVHLKGVGAWHYSEGNAILQGPVLSLQSEVVISGLLIK